MSSPGAVHTQGYPRACLPQDRRTLQAHPSPRALPGSEEALIHFSSSLCLTLPLPQPHCAPQSTSCSLLPGAPKPQTWTVFKMMSHDQDPSDSGGAHPFCQGLTAGVTIHISIRPVTAPECEAVTKPQGSPRNTARPLGIEYGFASHVSLPFSPQPCAESLHLYLSL